MAPWQSPWPLTRAHAAWSAMRSRAISATAALALRRDSADLFAVPPRTSGRPVLRDLGPPDRAHPHVRRLRTPGLAALRDRSRPSSGALQSCVPTRAVMHYGADPAVPWYKRSAKAGHSSAPGQGFNVMGRSRSWISPARGPVQGSFITAIRACGWTYELREHE